MVRERYLEDTLPLIVALEALLKVGRERLTAQFAQRTASLAGELGFCLRRSRPSPRTTTGRASFTGLRSTCRSRPSTTAL